MTQNFKTYKIEELAKQKAAQKRENVLAAINKMQEEGISITFSSVAKEAGVSRNYLYKSKEIRPLIESLRGEPVMMCKPKDARDIVIEEQKKRINELEKEIKNLKDKY